MDITAFIRELLFSHDCVILPGFGGFIGNYSPARTDKATCTFYPPVKLISFNRNLNHNDGLLIGRISASAGIGYGDGRRLVEEFVSEVKQKLSKGERVIFEHIGTFVNNSEGNVQFEPDREVNYHLNSFGLAPFQFPLLEGYDLKKRLIKDNHEAGHANPVFRKYLWRAAVIIPLIGTLIAVPLTTDIFKTKVETTSMNPLTVLSSDSGSKTTTPASPEVRQEKETMPESVTVVSEAEGKTATLQVPVQLQPAEEYCVIAGSFRLEANASVLAGKLTEEGYTPEIIAAPNGFYRVSAVKCATQQEAVSKKNIIGTKYPGAWVSRTK